MGCFSEGGDAHAGWFCNLGSMIDVHRARIARISVYIQTMAHYNHPHYLYNEKMLRFFVVVQQMMRVYGWNVE